MNARSEHRRGQFVIARTNRGLERGEVLCEATDHVLGQMKDPPSGTIQRESSVEDDHDHKQLMLRQKREFENCKRMICESGLPMSLVDVELIC